ncbi:MAG: hypothetical protein ACOYNX_11140 [Geothrix sp.]|nr:hypothetical protein [Acidobacteriota bacterium]
MPILPKFTATSIFLGLYALALAMLLAAVGLPLQAAEPRIVALHGLETAEVRSQGFTLLRAQKVHIYARGAGLQGLAPAREDSPLFASGWLLNAATREVVWQMDGANSRRESAYRIADVTLDLPAGSYEAYFANHAFAQGVFLAQWSRNVDRRHVEAKLAERPRGFLAAFGADEGGLLRQWRRQVGNYGMELYLPAGEAHEVVTFETPLRWAHMAITLSATGDRGEWHQAFKVHRPVDLHVYAVGEGTQRRMSDYGWILDVRTRQRVWEMTPERSQFAGGGPRNRRQVETIQLTPGDYVATFVTDDNHSPADWTVAPPCDPGLYGLALSLPRPGDAGALSLRALPEPGPVLAELVQVGNSQDRSAPFDLTATTTVRIHAIGEAGSHTMADTAWIEDASGKRVWEMLKDQTHHAGGASKNRYSDALVKLPKGHYTLRVKTDDSHAFGEWNSSPPRDPEHYGATVFGLK